MSADIEEPGTRGPERVRHAKQATSPVGDRLQRAYETWWHSVGLVHDVLDQPDATPAEVTERFQAEFDARREYANQLHDCGEEVPDYLAPDMTFPARWPVPQPPATREDP
jgi:hypothetical protein